MTTEQTYGGQGLWAPIDPSEFDAPPTEPGMYWAREIKLDLIGREMLSLPYQVKVVTGVPNAREHRLLVETNLKSPHHASLHCYRWGPPTAAEKNTMNNFANNFFGPPPSSQQRR